MKHWPAEAHLNARASVWFQTFTMGVCSYSNLRRKKGLLCQSLERVLQHEIQVVGAPLPLSGQDSLGFCCQPHLDNGCTSPAYPGRRIYSARWRHWHMQPRAPAEQSREVLQGGLLSSSPFLLLLALWAGERLGGKEQASRRNWQWGRLLLWQLPGVRSPGWQPPHSSTWTCLSVTSPCCLGTSKTPLAGALLQALALREETEHAGVWNCPTDTPFVKGRLTGSILQGFVRTYWCCGVSLLTAR